MLPVNCEGSYTKNSRLSQIGYVFVYDFMYLLRQSFVTRGTMIDLTVSSLVSSRDKRVAKMFTLTRETFSALHSRRVLSEFRTYLCILPLRIVSRWQK